MEQIDIQTWDLLDLIKENAEEIIEEMGSIEADGMMYIYCLLGEDYFELFYNEEDFSHVKYLSSEDDLKKAIQNRKEEFFPKEFDNDFFDEDE